MGATDGAGITGDAIGTTIMRSTTPSGIPSKAGRFITATDSIEANTPAVITITLKELHGPQAGTANAHRVITTVPKGRHSLSGATTGPLAAPPSLAVRAEFGRAPSTGTVMVERNAAFRRAEAPASAAEAVFAAGATEST